MSRSPKLKSKRTLSSQASMMELTKFVPYTKRADYSSDDDKDEEIMEREKKSRQRNGHASTEYLYNRFDKIK